MSQRLNTVRAEATAAKAEFDAAFRSEGFTPVRAEKAQSRLEAAKAALASAIIGEQGELNRERALANLERRLAGAQRVLRAVEFNFRRALHEVGGISPENSLEYNESRLESLRVFIEADSRKGGLKPSNRNRFEHSKAILAEAQYRLDEVKKVREQIAEIGDNIAALMPQRGIAAA